MNTHEYEQPSGQEPGRQRTAYDFRRRYEWLNRFNDDELRKITLCNEGDELRPGEHYFDVSHPERGIVTAQASQRVPEGACYVARREVTSRIWEKLISDFGQ